MPSAALALALLAAEPPTPGVQWNWQAPAGCPDAAATRRRLAETTQAACALEADARVEASGDEWRLELELRRSSGVDRRILTAGTCEALADAAIVIVAVACTDETVVDVPVTAVPQPPTSETSTSETTTSDETSANDPAAVTDDATASAGPDAAIVDNPEPDTATATASPSPAANPRAPRPSRTTPTNDQPRANDPPSSRRPLGELGLRGGVSWNTPAGLVGLLARVRWRRLDVTLATAYTTARQYRYADAPALGVAQRLVHAGLAAGPALAWGRGRWRGRGALSAGVEAGAMLGTGIGAPNNVTRARPWVALGLVPLLSWLPHDRISVDLGVDLLFAVVRPAFNLEDREPIARATAFGVRLHTSLLVRLF